MSIRLKNTLESQSVEKLKLRSAVIIKPQTPISEAIGELQKAKTGCLLIQTSDKIEGIFTERDILTRVIPKNLNGSESIELVMTAKPTCISTSTSIADAIQLMNNHSFRHLPVVDEKNKIAGIISVRDILVYLAEHFPYQVFSVPPDPHQINIAPEGA